MQVFFSSVRSRTAQRLLKAHGVVGPEATGRPVFATLDQALQHCEEHLLNGAHSPTRRGTPGEQQLDVLLLDYVDGFVSEHRLAAANAAAAQALTSHFQRRRYEPEQLLFRQTEPADAIFVIAAGSVRVSSHRQWTANVATGFLPSPTQVPIAALARQRSCDSDDENRPHRLSSGNRAYSAFSLRSQGSGNLRERWSTAGGSAVNTTDLDEEPCERVGVGGILGDTAYFARRQCGCDAAAEGEGCVAHVITRETMEKLELADPGIMVFLQKVLLRDLAQLQVQFVGPMQLAGGLS
uniref:Cyclic nucleotide-binding domain-containing protein n=1 Tax=Alexandrium andersonii TaxID=327968 RepID=A0A7S2GIH8_9DINO